MRINRFDTYLTMLFIAILCQLVLVTIVKAHTRFRSNYTCNDGVKTCVSSGEKIVEGFSVTRPCWQYSYSKNCMVPSKNDCAQHARCYSLGQADCLLHDLYGNCINLKKEFSCKRWVPVVIESETVRYGLKDKAGSEGWICKGIPCIDGNCVDKSYDIDADMVSSLARLSALAQGKNVNSTFKIFEGLGRTCAKKAGGYSNCCSVSQKGWGKELGSECTKDEQDLTDRRGKNLCIYVGKEHKKTIGLTMIVKHHFCCFSNSLEKTIQVQARKQLGMNFGNGGSANCRGLTLEEISRVDFSKMDFSEVAAEMQKKIKLPNIYDVENRLKNSLKNTNSFDEKQPVNPQNKAAGVNTKIIGD